MFYKLNRMTLTAAIAIFSMFFGAGNTVFPLVVGQQSGELSGHAIAGLLLTAIGGPLLGLFAGVAFRGDCTAFFLRLGKGPGYALIAMITLLLGPCAVMPRCVIVAHAATQSLTSGIDLATFSLLFGIACYLCLLRRDQILPLLGRFLSPLLLLFLVLIISFGLGSGAGAVGRPMSVIQAWQFGAVTGYDTMDLLAALFFSQAIWTLLAERLFHTNKETLTKLPAVMMTSCLVAGLLLGSIYIGLGVVASIHSTSLETIAPEFLLTTLAHQTLGPIWGGMANLAIALACLTTVVSLALTFADLLHRELHQLALSYQWKLVGLLLITVIFSNLGFARIMTIIHAIVALCYPAIIVLTICNLGHRLFGWRVVKAPFWITLASTWLLSRT